MIIIVVLIFLEENFGDLSKNFNRDLCIPLDLSF